MFRIQNDGILTIHHLILDGNKENHSMDNAANRSLVILMGGTLTLQEDAVIQDNNTNLEGGGVYLSGSSNYANHFIMEDNAIIRGCYARTNGGGIVAAIRNVNDSLVIRNQATIENNSANYGGGLYYRIYTEGVESSVTISDTSIFRNNSSNNSGAAMAFFNIADNQKSLQIHILDAVQLTNNQAVNHGGGIYFVGTNSLDQIHIGKSVIESNQAGGYGGGIYTNQVLTELNGTLIQQNSAGTGGGLYVVSTQGGTLNLTSSSILANQATKGASGSGGGIWINNRSTSNPFTLTIKKSTISNNQASASGGGIYLSEQSSGLRVLMDEVEIRNNLSGLNGGGMLLAAAGTGSIQILHNSIMQNNGNNYGGGVYISNENAGICTVALTLSNISNNQSGAQGGGLRLSSGKGVIQTTIEDCLIENNVVHTSSGGGIWCGGAHASLSLTKSTKVNQNESIEGNGGGIYFNSQNGIITLHDDVQITNNLASQNQNIIRNHGGGIFLVPGNLQMMDNSEISGNKARYGGGIGTSEGSIVTIESGKIFNNEATYGGGIHNQDSTIYLENVEITHNHASIGGGIYNQ